MPPKAKKQKTAPAPVAGHCHKFEDIRTDFLSTRKDYPGKFPMPMETYREIKIDPFAEAELSAKQIEDLEYNIQLCRDAVIFFSSCGNASGYGGHSGGAFDTIPECMILDAMFRGCPDKFVDTFFDEAGHRVCTQYLFAALQGYIPWETLVNYRRGFSLLPGHPEVNYTPGIKFCSGRLGHMWATVDGVAAANPGKIAIMLGSDGSQMEGNDAEAARLAVSENLNVKLFIDDNNVTIAGHPSEYFKGYDVAKTLEGHGIPTTVIEPETCGVQGMYAAMRLSMVTTGPYAVIMKRKMCPGIDGLEGSCHGHDSADPKYSIPHLRKRGYGEAADFIAGLTKSKDPYQYEGSEGSAYARKIVGKTIAACIGAQGDEKTSKTLVIDSDLGGSTAMNEVQKAHPETYMQSGIMERANFAAAAGFGMGRDAQGITSTFGAFQEMIMSEATMARLNHSNVLSHYSHCGVDDMADNTCHFGINQLFADNGLPDAYETKLYWPVDGNQTKSLTEVVFADPGLRFIYTTRAATKNILTEAGEPFYGPDFKFVSGKDDVIRTGTAGYIMAVGDCIYRALDAVVKLKKAGIDVGLIAKSTLNVIDEESIQLAGKSPFLLIIEPLNVKTGIASKYGSELLKRGLSPKFDNIGIYREGSGGLWEHAYHQGYDSESVQAKVKSMVA